MVGVNDCPGWESCSTSCCTPSYSDVDKSVSTSGQGNSFCQVVKMLDLGPKGPRLKSTYCQSGDPEEHVTPTLNPTTRWQHQKSHQISP
ncbi:hypothetical protein AVEN_190883-1 [Araneus ventricosus]|uniref:Uncharacterized protein n=1 Tax=Araneus ventricosus TaxID=182803 RepID=A0A4Y2CRW5_ARAVE|nr:hypothetical protein AVEN_190883-1 [Araneus ventricosus]